LTISLRLAASDCFLLSTFLRHFFTPPPLTPLYCIYAISLRHYALPPLFALRFALVIYSNAILRHIDDASFIAIRHIYFLLMPSIFTRHYFRYATL